MKIIYLILVVGVAFAISYSLLGCNDTKATMAANAKSEKEAAIGEKSARLNPFLTTTWRHSREEDVSDVRCFRPADYAFPPSRGVRTSYTFKADYTGFKGSTAPNDAENRENFTYKMQNNVITLNVGKNIETYTIVSIDKDKLMLAETKTK